ncbi:MAG: Crp/Fnr family transcriptional regulator [Mariprofundaceae bacterium]
MNTIDETLAHSFEVTVATNPRFMTFRGLPVVRELGCRESRLLFLCFEECLIKQGTVVYKAGEKSENIMYLIIEGSISVSHASHHVHTSLHPGDVFGLFSFLDRDRLHSATVRSESDVAVFSMNRDYFDVITLEDPALGGQLLRFMFRLLSRMALNLEVEYAALREFALASR